MRNILLIVLLTFFTSLIYAQTVDEKIKKVLELDGTISNIENLMSEIFENQKYSHFGISENFWNALEKKVGKKSLDEFESIVITILSRNYTESEIDNLITFYSSDTGKLITEKQPIILNQLNLELMQWSQNLNSYILEEIENLENNISSTEEIENFKNEFKTKYGLQILNIGELAIDNEHNIGSLLVDFGKTDGLEDITKVIRVKNNSSNEITFEEPLFLIDDDIKFDWGNIPIQAGEIRDLKIILNSEKAENRRYAFLKILSSDGNSIPIGVKYDAPTKEIKFDISKNKLKYTKLKKGLSQPYIFILKNTGKIDFYISNIEVDKPFAYLNYSRETLKPNQETEIRVIFSRELIDKLNIKNVKLNMEVNLKKGEKGGFSDYSNTKIELIIE